MDSSAPAILPPQVQVPSTSSKQLSFMVKFGLYLSCEKNENKHKDAGFGPFLLKNDVFKIEIRLIGTKNIFPDYLADNNLVF